ncbi:MAG: hypothetical protein RLZZ303_2865 [Candidatus Hydrogenedentota bacterium]
MTALLLLLTAAAAAPQSMPELLATPPGMLAEKPRLNVLPGDIDGDGQSDLLFSTHARLQRDGGFPEAGHIALPAFAGAGWLDLNADGELCFLVLEDENAGQACAFQSFRYAVGAWEQTAFRPLGDSSPDCGGTAKVALMPFLLDEGFAFLRNGLLHVAQTGMDVPVTEIFREVIPGLTANLERSPGLWPPANRSFINFESGMRARLLLGAQGVELWSWQASGEGIALSRRMWTRSGESASSTSSLPPLQLAPGNEAAFIDGDNYPDLVSWQREEAPLSAFRLPSARLSIRLMPRDLSWTTSVLAPGSSFPPPRFVDVNGDGLLDLFVLGMSSSQTGARELALQMLTRKAITCEARVYLQTPEEGFAQSPALRRAFDLALDASPVEGGHRMDSLASGGLASMDGDFDGDGWKDLVLHAELGKATLLRATAAGFAPDPLMIEVPETARLTCADLNGNGQADLIVFEAQTENSTVVHLR